ncbi:hypothetical protein PPERSA_02804 [Pseudocohnilembus persalinus]|uniref:Uncharacterized protein n=1 Tax=Pseudocohnilembus persalinus TaxID=266149 RepID=A0A0V0QMX6_PSEPJ|nr:hypothetical protein PPERSA_02804 [Pseudocohnilembus persalinus]|eukprot:KRX03425.1 hypothetical protein PPERSA_02804 [Pseudocohnilembus persalinus]
MFLIIFSQRLLSIIVLKINKISFQAQQNLKKQKKAEQKAQEAGSSRRAFKPYEQDQFGYAAYPNPQDQQSEQQQYNIKNENEEPFKLIPVQEQAQEEINKEQIQQEKKPSINQDSIIKINQQIK